MVLSGDGMRRDTADAKRVELRVHTQAVTAGPNRIADLMDEIEPSYEKWLPQIPHAHDIIKSMSYDKAKELYGRNLPRIVQERLDQELAVILEHGYSSLYLLQQKLVQKRMKMVTSPVRTARSVLLWQRI